MIVITVKVTAVAYQQIIFRLNVIKYSMTFLRAVEVRDQGRSGGGLEGEEGGGGLQGGLLLWRREVGI